MTSPCVDIRLPGIDRDKRGIPEPEQVHRLAELMPERLAASVYVAAGCGLRLGEVLGLKVGDVDFVRAHLDGLDLPPMEADDDTDPRRPTRRPAELVFRAASGEPVNASTFSRTWTPVRAQLGLPPRWDFHGLRHYYATLLIQAGASVKTVHLALGHSTPTITLN